jgi:putative membrane protein
MKHKFIIITPLSIAVAIAVSLCAYQFVQAQEDETKSSAAKEEASPSETKAETKTTTATKSEKPKVSAADKKFVENAAKGGMMEVSMGKAASERAANSDVKQFGERMVRDHTKANNELKSIASKKGITLPKEEPAHNFKTDRAYMDMMVKDHEKDLAEFQKQAKNGSDPDLKKFADDTSKIVSEHLSMARRISKNLKRETSSLAR